MTEFKKNKILILIALGILVIAAICFFLTKSEYDKKIALRTSTENKAITLNNQKEKLSSLQKLNKQPEEVKTAKDFSLKQLPDDVEATIFVSYLEKLGNSVQVTPLSVSVNSAAVENKSKTDPTSNVFNVTFSSDFPTLLTFISQMEKLDRLNTLSNLSLSPTESLLNVTISGKIYVYRSSK